ncbi:(deoxy)nucleoside triphosphate pyrophosphohydrolase [Pontibacter sp. JH31]|uniref:8-oxo-dGTP diphosphatase n=1 Tax=Pontibacter aquaedesilientis TaxID=2766980 RepID=A0ABR7XCV1_9BACT|nr:(deoxy)nucleoside triphosphate pyrophosphohydrolase [Pontibacter aquaedesilientis]MBD1396129.1 (deoxy)nucleoside triphosphate pyrophosphohydrolase [Pontibacter aquaedesilientis]
MLIKVTCAIIEQFGRVLITQRSETMTQALLWEFPGGKIEEGETETECLTREITEELNLIVTPTQRLTPVQQQYPTYTIELIPYICQYNRGTIQLAEHKTYHWVTLADLNDYAWCPADLPIVKEYLSLQLTV